MTLLRQHWIEKNSKLQLKGKKKEEENADILSSF